MEEGKYIGVGFSGFQYQHVLLSDMFVAFDGLIARGQGQGAAGPGLEAFDTIGYKQVWLLNGSSDHLTALLG